MLCEKCERDEKPSVVAGMCERCYNALYHNSYLRAIYAPDRRDTLLRQLIVLDKKVYGRNITSYYTERYDKPVEKLSEEEIEKEIKIRKEALGENGHIRRLIRQMDQTV